MEILIVDDESSTREALRDLLVELGHKTVLEARDGEEALKILNSEKTRVRMIVADWEMPGLDGVTLSDRIAASRNLNLIPFLLITSDLSGGKFEELKKQHQRIDHALLKPFRLKILDEGMKQAYVNRASKRDAILWLGSAAAAPSLLEAISLPKKGQLFRRVSTDLSSGDFGAILIDLESNQLDSAALTGLRKTPLGNSVPWIGLSRNPDQIGSFRTLCHQFIDLHTLQTPASWSPVLDSVAAKLLNSWGTELLTQEAKSLLQQKKTSDARKMLEQILALDPINSEAHAWIADILLQEGDLKRAMQHEFESLQINPCMPKPYIKLLEIIPKSDRSRVSETAEMARKYCPKSSDVLQAADVALGKGEKLSS